MPAQVNKSRGSSIKSPVVEKALVKRATEALLKHHQAETASNDKQALLGDDTSIQVQFGLDRVPVNPSPKPIRVEIPHALYKLSEESLESDGLEEPSVCLIVKEESKPWVVELLSQFPEQLKFVKKVLGLQSLRKKHGRFEQRRELVRRFDVFMADDRILPMLTKSLGKEFFHVKKQPIPIVLTRKEALPYTIVKALQSTFLYISAGTSLTVRAGTTGMPVKNLVENIQSIIRSAVPKIPRKWANIRSIAIKTPTSMSLPIYNKTPEELVEIAKLAGIEPTNMSQENDTVDESEVAKIEAEEQKQRKLAATKSPLVQALKKQKELEEEKEDRKETKIVEKKSKKKKSDKDAAEKTSKKRRKDTSDGGDEVSSDPAKKAKKSSEPTKPAQFIASTKYAGSKKGYVFRSGKEGVGYYLDVKPVVDLMAMEALKRLASASSGKKSGKKGRKDRR